MTLRRPPNHTRLLTWHMPTAWLSVCSLIMVLGVTGTGRAGEVLDRVVAVVNSDIVTLSEVRERLLQIQGQATVQEVLNDLIEERLIDREAERLGITVRDDEIDTAIENRRQAIGVTTEDFERILEREGLSMTLYRHTIEQGLRRVKLIDRMVKRDITITDEELATFYAQHAEQLQQAAEARIAEFFIRAPTSLPTESRARTRTHMDEYRRRILAGESFTDLARAHSDGATAELGGDLGFLNISEMRAEFRSAALSLSVGQVSDVIETERGYHLLTITETRSGEVIPFAKVRQRIRSALFQEKTVRRYTEWVQELRANARIDIRL